MESILNYSTKIVFLDAGTLNKNIDLDRFNEFGEFVIYEQTASDKVIERIQDANIVLTNKVIIDKSIIESCPSLKLICITATGTNNIDHESAAIHNIQVNNVKGYSTNSVAQITFAMALNQLSSLTQYSDYTKTGKWCDSYSFTCQNWPIVELVGKTWGIIGLGTIGQKVAQIAKAFDCNVQYYSTSGKNKNNDFKSVDLETLLKTSHVISIHAPLNGNTKNLLKKNELNLIEAGSVLINVGRGGIINEQDLLEVLQNKNIFVSLDVAELEPMSKTSALFELKNHKNVLITPHIAWASLEAQELLISNIYKQIKEFLDSKNLTDKRGQKA